MFENPYTFEIPTHQRSIIKVIGVGGGGSNAVNYMHSQGIAGVDFVVCNTDNQALQNSKVPNKLQLGKELTKGLGAGSRPAQGTLAAEESIDDINTLLGDGTQMVFVTAGMGGGTGTGAAPIIAKAARELGILTVGIVTMPFGFEGPGKKASAEAGVAELRKHCDTLLVILNDKLADMFGKMPFSMAFAQADMILCTAARSIADFITSYGTVNVDFQDVKTVMKDSGTAVMGSAVTEGEDRAQKAALSAISSPLLNSRDIKGASKILISLQTGEEELTMDELAAVSEYIQQEAGLNADLKYGVGTDTELGKGIRVTVIATGFERPSYFNGEEAAPAAQQTAAPVAPATEPVATQVAETPAATAYTEYKIESPNPGYTEIKPFIETPVAHQPAPQPYYAPQAQPPVQQQPVQQQQGVQQYYEQQPSNQRHVEWSNPYENQPAPAPRPANRVEAAPQEPDFTEVPRNQDYSQPVQRQQRPIEAPKDYYNLNGEKMISPLNDNQVEKPIEISQPQQGNNYEAFRRQAADRVLRMREMGEKGKPLLDGEAIKDMETPAYLRRRVSLDDNVGQANTPKASRYNYNNEEREILGDNRFFSDPVD